ncbi:MAG: hypothetical protein FWE41_09220 [Coriobacteriia bacterium]|nr:hypothetical protein [Coriobacteriia bacterium]MCL2749963.1 hypothetical protein [Coriobacteriia bacterium]
MKNLVLSLTLCVALIFGCTLSGCQLPVNSEPEPETNQPIVAQVSKAHEREIKPYAEQNTNQNTNQNANQGSGQSFTADQQKIRYNARYLYEQKSLPQFLFSNESDFIKCFQNSDTASVEKELRIEWEFSVAMTLIPTLSADEQAYALQGSDELFEVLDRLTPQYGLGPEHIVSVTLETIDSNRSCFLIEMLELDEELLCTYIAIVYSAEGGLNYYTVERTMSFGSSKNEYMFCYIDQQGRGSLGLVDSNKESVLKAIRDLK